MHKGSWDDLRFVLAVAESGSVNAAARRLGVNHATVLRRIAAFEAAQGVPIFDRTAQGYAVLPDRLRVIEAAREAAQSIDTVARLMRGAETQLSGAVRITSTDSFCQTILPPIVAELMARSEGLSIELMCSNAHLDLGRLGADITIRPAIQLSPDLRGEAAGMLGFAVYGAARGRASWLALRGTLARSRPGNWLEDTILPAELSGGADSFVVLRELAALGQGRAILPCPLGDADPRLERISGVMPPMPVPIWVASHADLADAPRLRAIRAKLVAALLAQGETLSGEGAHRNRTLPM